MTRKLEENFEPIPGYRLKRYLGRGGFGEVWETEAPGGISKAIKLAPMEMTEENLNCRELQGLQKIRAIRHPYLLSIERFEIIPDGYLAIVMELADKSLEDRYNECEREGKPGIPREELLRYMTETAEVLDLMNQHHSLQHMDIKPANLFLSSGHVKVADFGLVQPRNTNMSVAALAVSPPYAPPELFDGRVDSTADQYSLAVTYMELLTGRRPFTATDVRGLIMQHLRGRPDLSSLSAGDRPVLTRALQRDATKRFSSCKEFVEQLIRASKIQAEVAPPPEATGEEKKPSAVPTESTDKAKFVVHRSSRPLQRADTTPMKLPSHQTTPVAEEAPSDVVVSDDKRVRAAFLAYLPLEIYAHKLRGFIDAIDAEIVSCTDEKATLRLVGRRGWFGLGSPRCVFMELDSYCPSRNSGMRVVDVMLWTSNDHLQGEELGRRAQLLIHCLKGHLMATERTGFHTNKRDVEIREEVLR